MGCGKLNDADMRRCPCGRFMEDVSNKRAAERQPEGKKIENMSWKELITFFVSTAIILTVIYTFAKIGNIADWMLVNLTYLGWKRSWKWKAVIPGGALYLLSFTLGHTGVPPNFTTTLVLYLMAFGILALMITFERKRQAYQSPVDIKQEHYAVILEKIKSFATSRPIFAYILAGYLGLALLIFTPFYNYTFARDNGFFRWFMFGEVVATAKAAVWPYFLLTSSSSSIPRDFDECMIKYSKNTINNYSLFFIRKSCKAFSEQQDSDYDRCILNNIQGINNIPTVLAVNRKCNPPQ